MPSQTVDWTDFSMRPVHPTQVDNPVTRTVNMVYAGNGLWRRRAGFGSRAGPGATVLNHISCELGGVSMVVAKCSDGSVRYWNGTAWTTLAGFVDPTDKPVGNAAWSTSERGSLEIHAGEVYICDSLNIAAYDGLTSNQLRRPGVKSLAGYLYYKDGGKPSFNLAKVEGVGNATLVDLLDDFRAVDDSPLAADGTDPGLVLFQGEKVLNTGFCFSVYDPKRNIYGRRSEVCALPYVFGPPNPHSEDAILVDERVQYAKQVRTPGSTFIPAGHRVAVWFTLGQEVITNKAATIFSGWLFFFDQNAPGMSPRMTSVLFLEQIADPGSTVVATKDQAALFRSGQYVDAYGRPAPAKLLVILANGTALYFYPRSDAESVSSPIGNYAEWSVDHPEQVGRLTENNRDTKGPIANVKAELLYTVSDGDRSLILTRQTVYQVGFDGRGAVLQDATNGRGISAPDSICVSSAGIFWIADEGVAALRGGAITMLDKRLGFGDWFDGLNDAQRSQASIGACERTSQLFAYAADADGTGPGAHRGMVFDWERGVQSELRLAIGQPYRWAYHRGGASRLLAFVSAGSMYAYPDGTTDGGVFYDSFIELWVTENALYPKTMQELVLHLGPSNGLLTVTCDAYEHPEVTAPFVGTRSETYTVQAGGARRLTVPTFIGMRGRLFRFTVKSSGVGAATSWSISRAIASYKSDADSDARSV